MFIGRRRIDDVRTRIQTVRSQRTGGKVRQRVLRHVGAVRGAAETEVLEGVGRLVMEELRAARSGPAPLLSIRESGELGDLARGAAENPRPAGVEFAGCRHEGRVEAGTRQAFGAVYSGLGWDSLGCSPECWHQAAAG